MDLKSIVRKSLPAVVRLKCIIESSFRRIHDKDLKNEVQVVQAVSDVIQLLDQGSLRVAEKLQSGWHTHEWIRKAILLHFAVTSNRLYAGKETNCFDKVPLKFADYTSDNFAASRLRVVPNAVVRYGSYIADNCVIMPSFINIGAFIGANSLIDTWASVGSCAQIGSNVHISGGAGIGGVLEPLQKAPTIIEDNCFIGARSEIAEGVRVEEGAVVAMGVFIGQSTPIYDRRKDVIYYGVVPRKAVVVPGSLPDRFGKCSINCAVIVKTVDGGTQDKTALNGLLREISTEKE